MVLIRYYLVSSAACRFYFFIIGHVAQFCFFSCFFYFIFLNVRHPIPVSILIKLVDCENTSDDVQDFFLLSVIKADKYTTILSLDQTKLL